MPDNSNLWSQVLSDPEQAAMQPETFVNPVVKKHVADVANLIGMPGRAYSSTEPIPSEQMVGPAFEIAKQFGMLGVPMSKPGTAGIFGGKLAKGADLNKMDKAKLMASEGGLPNDIVASTGWHRSPADHEWRYEIPDYKSSMQYMPHVEGDTATGPVGALFRHPELFKAYPELENMQLELTKQSRYPAGTGNHYPALNKIDIQAPNAAAARLVLLHELQHGVQGIEGFSPGGNPGQIAGLLEAGVKKTNPDYSKIYDWEGIRNQANDMYWKLSGENEARNVMNRANLSPAELKRDMPWDTHDIEYIDQFHRNPNTNMITALRDKALK